MDLSSLGDFMLYHNPLRAWLVAVGILAVCFLALRIMNGLIRRRLAPLVAGTTTLIDDSFFGMLQRTKNFFLLLIAAYIGRLALQLPQGAAKTFSVIVILGMLVQAGIWGTALIMFHVRRYAAERLAADPSATTTVSAIGFFARIGLWTVLVLLALDNVGVDVTALIAGLGLGGIAIALALQNILSDLFASLSIVFDKPFVVGDSIAVDTFSGTVEHVGLKTTRVRSVSGEQLIFSNNDLLQSRIRNLKRMEDRRAELTLRVAYGTPVAKLEAIPGMIREIISRDPRARFERCHLKQAGESALIFESIYWVPDPDYQLFMDIQQGIVLSVVRAFQEAGIAFAYPTQTIHLNEAAPHPSLAGQAPSSHTDDRAGEGQGAGGS